MAGQAVIAKRIKALRLRAGMSQKALGIAAGIDEFSSSPRMNSYEKQKHSPDYLTLERIGKVLGVPAAYFFSADDDLAELIELYSALPDAGKRKILNALKASVKPKK